MEHPLIYPFIIWMSLGKKKSMYFLCLFFNGIVCFSVVELYEFFIYWILTSYLTYGLQIFSPVGCLLILLIVSSAAWKLSICCSIDFCFCCLCFFGGGIFKKIIAKINDLPYISSRSFIDSGVMCKPFIYFE